MSFVFLKFLHVAFMFLGVAFAIGPTALLALLMRSVDAQTLRHSLPLTHRIFQISTACYGLGVVFGFVAALTGTLDLAAPWLLTAYVLVAVLGLHGILFDRWTKQVSRSLTSDTADATRDAAGHGHERAPIYYLSAMVVLVVAIVYVMVTKPSLF